MSTQQKRQAKAKLDYQNGQGHLDLVLTQTRRPEKSSEGQTMIFVRHTLSVSLLINNKRKFQGTFVFRNSVSEIEEKVANWLSEKIPTAILAYYAIISVAEDLKARTDIKFSVEPVNSETIILSSPQSEQRFGTTSIDVKHQKKNQIVQISLAIVKLVKSELVRNQKDTALYKTSHAISCYLQIKQITPSGKNRNYCYQDRYAGNDDTLPVQMSLRLSLGQQNYPHETINQIVNAWKELQNSVSGRFDHGPTPEDFEWRLK